MFIWNSRHTHRYPVSEIASIGPYVGGKANDREHLATARMRDGSEVVISEYDATKLLPEEAFIAVIPAPHGYAILSVSLDPEPPCIYRTPVVAWFATASGHLTPATMAGAWDQSAEDAPVEGPDGRVWHGAEQVDYDSADSMLADMVATRKRRSEQAAAKADEVEAVQS